MLSDPRDPGRIVHSMRDLLAQRIYGLCCGHEDLNDHDRLREDVLMQTALGRVDALASSPTLCRMETRATRGQIWALHEVLVEQFIASQAAPPSGLVLDIDASDIPLHGKQELREFHGYYDHHCYLPLYVFCGEALLACYLRRSRIDGAKNATALIKLLIAATAPGLARCGDHRARGFGLLPPAPDALVRAPWRGLRPGHGAQRTPGGDRVDD